MYIYGGVGAKDYSLTNGRYWSGAVVHGPQLWAGDVRSIGCVRETTVEIAKKKNARVLQTIMWRVLRFFFFLLNIRRRRYEH